MVEKVILVAVVLCLGLVNFSVANWPGFLGPNRNGISNETGLARQWAEGGPDVLWTIDVGPGFGGASIFDGQVFLLDRDDDTYDVLRCVDLETGKELWRWTRKVEGRTSFNGSRGVPSITETCVFAMGPMGQLYAVDQKTHKIRWMVDLAKDYQALPPEGYGFSQSPLICGNLVVVSVMTKDIGMVAFDVITGQERWRTVPLGEMSHTSPIEATLAGQKGILFLEISKMFFIDPKNGKVLWDYSALDCYVTIPGPTVVDEHHVFLTTGYDRGSVFLEINRKGATFSAKELFRLEKEGSQISTVVYHKGHLYGNFTRNENMKNPTGMVCLNREGAILWQSGKEPTFGRGNFILADGLIFILNAQSGELAMVDPNPEGYKELGRVKVLDAKGKNVFAPLAISQGRLIIRDQHKMVCLDLVKR